MTLLSFNKLSLKEINRQQVYAAIYREPMQSKQQLARSLNMSLSTVDSNIKSLMQSGLLEEAGTLESTGGRKAQSYQINAHAHYAIGLFLLDEKVIATAVDLNGAPLWEEHFSLELSDHAFDDSYYTLLRDHLTKLLHKHKLQTEQCLGLAFAVQGTVTASTAETHPNFTRASSAQTPDHVNYGILLLKSGQQITLEQVQSHFSLPCSLYHDAKAAAFAELWERPHIDNAALFLLNQNLGGSLIFNNMVHYGNQGRGGLVEHLKVGHEGRLCYCGNQDCLECYCSKLRSADAAEKSPDLVELWQKYLHYLGVSIYNASRLIDGKIILTGALAPYLQQSDLKTLLECVNRYPNSFNLEPDDLILSPRSDAVVALGAGRHLINAYLEHFGANPINDQCYHANNLELHLPELASANSSD